MRLNALLISLATLSLSASAFAQPREPGASAANIESSAAPFDMLDLQTAHAASAEFMFARTSALPFGQDALSSAVLTLSGHAEVTPGLRLEGRLPIAYASTAGESETDIGNLALGAQYIRRVGLVSAGGGLRIYVPTASAAEESGNNGLGALGALFTQFDRAAEFLPDTTTYRGHGDVRYDNGQAFVQGQLALDLSKGDGINNDELLKLVKVGVAGGFRPRPALALIAELTTLSSILEDTGEDEDRFLHWGRVGARYQISNVGLGVHFYASLDSIFEDTIGGGLDATASF